MQFFHHTIYPSSYNVILMGYQSGVELMCNSNRVANRPGMAGIVPELTHAVPCPGRGSFCPGNVKINHRAWIYSCLLRSVYFVLCLSVTHDLT